MLITEKVLNGLKSQHALLGSETIHIKKLSERLRP